MNKKTISERDVKHYTLNIIQQMNQEQYTPEYVCGFARGGLVVANYISQWYDIPMYAINKDQKFDCKLDFFTNVLIVDDINDTGKTLNDFKEKYGKHQDFKYAALVDNAGSCFETDFAGHYINKLEVPDWIVFPWENWWHS